jgi:hypothetical protein
MSSSSSSSSSPEFTDDSNWDTDMLLQLGANKEFIESLTVSQARELLKNIFYAIERYRDAIAAKEESNFD